MLDNHEKFALAMNYIAKFRSTDVEAKIALAIKKIIENYNAQSFQIHRKLPGSFITRIRCQFYISHFKIFLLSPSLNAYIQLVLHNSDVQDPQILSLLTNIIQTKMMHSVDMKVKRENGERISIEGYAEFDQYGRLTNKYIKNLFEDSREAWQYSQNQDLAEEITRYKEEIEIVTGWLMEENELRHNHFILFNLSDINPAEFDIDFSS